MERELKNIGTYKLYAIFNNLLIIGPILTIFYLAKGLNYTQIMLLTSIASVTTIIFEVPTGVVADRFSRKLSIILGCIFCGLGLSVIIVGQTFFFLALAEIIFSIGLCFRSGTEQALLYDSLKNNNKIDLYPRIEGKAKSFTYIAQAIGSIVASFFYTLNIHLPFIISIGFMMIAGVIATFFIEPEQKNSIIKVSYKIQLKESFNFIATHKKIRGVILFSLVFTYFYRVGFNYFQPYMNEVGIPVIYFGVIFFIFNIVAALSSRMTPYFLKLTRPKSLMMLSLLIIVSFLLCGFIRHPIGIIAILLQQVARGLKYPVFQKYLNKHLPSNKRSTILSMQNLLNSLVISIFAPFAGYLLDNIDIYNSHIILAIIMLVFVIFTHQYMKYLIDTSRKVG